MKNFKNSVLVASAFASFALAATSFAAPVRPVVPTIPTNPGSSGGGVIAEPEPTDAEQAAYDAADRIGARMSAGANDLYRIRQATLTAVSNAAAQGAEFGELQKIAKKAEKEMRKVVKATTKDMKKLFKQGAKEIKAAGGSESNVSYLSDRMSEDQGDLNEALTRYLSNVSVAIENALDRP